MLKSKEALANRLKGICVANIGNRKFIQNTMLDLKDKFNMPISQSNDILTLRTDIADESEFTLFCLLSVINENILSSYFTDIEIDKYSVTKFVENKVKFPIKFDMIQIADDQWIGRISVKELMGFRDAQLIRYNENAQRTMQHIVNGDTEYYKIALNKSAVAGIQQSFSNDTYIPNTITLNMPEDTDFNYSNGVLAIREIEQFDILDGYHRYIAMSKQCNADSDFDYNMELRIVSFSEDKAKQFIWQEDQKTKMKKVDTDSFDQNSEANKIVQRINTDSTFILSGQVSRNKCIINSAELSLLIRTLWFQNSRMSKKNSLKIAMEIKPLIEKGIESVIEKDSSFLDKQWDFKWLACVITCVYDGIDASAIYDTAKRIRNEYKENISPNKATKSVLTRLQKLI